MEKLYDISEVEAALKKGGRIVNQIAYAAGRTLNEVAYESRGFIQSEISSAHKIRQPGLIRAMIVYDKTKRSKNINDLEARAGTRMGPELAKNTNFTGWEENERGSADKRKRKWNEDARKNKSESGVVQPKYRFKPGRKIPKINGGQYASKTQKLAKQKYYNKPFMMTNTGNSELPDGVYILMRAEKKGKVKIRRIASLNSEHLDKHKPSVEKAATVAERIIYSVFVKYMLRD